MRVNKIKICLSRMLISACLMIFNNAVFSMTAHAICMNGQCDTMAEAYDLAENYCATEILQCECMLEYNEDNHSIDIYTWYGGWNPDTGFFCDEESGRTFLGGYGWREIIDHCKDSPDPCCGSDDPCCGSCDPCCEEKQGGDGSGGGGGSGGQ